MYLSETKIIKSRVELRIAPSVSKYLTQSFRRINIYYKNLNNEKITFCFINKHMSMQL